MLVNVFKKHLFEGAVLRLAAALAAIAAGAGLLGAGSPSAVAGGGCRGVPATEADGSVVTMNDQLCFLPTVLHAKPGESITWTNAGSAPHSVAAATLGWGNYAEVAGGGTVSYTFDQPGTYPYYCFVHPGMTGAIVVGDGHGPPSIQVHPVRAVQVGAPAQATVPVVPVAAVVPPTDDSRARWLYAGMGALGGLAVAGLRLWVVSVRRSARP
jgi:plastocyanin